MPALFMLKKRREEHYAKQNRRIPRPCPAHGEWSDPVLGKLDGLFDHCIPAIQVHLCRLAHDLRPAPGCHCLRRLRHLEQPDEPLCAPGCQGHRPAGRIQRIPPAALRFASGYACPGTDEACFSGRSRFSPHASPQRPGEHHRVKSVPPGRAACIEKCRSKGFGALPQQAFCNAKSVFV